MVCVCVWCAKRAPAGKRNRLTVCPHGDFLHPRVAKGIHGRVCHPSGAIVEQPRRLGPPGRPRIGHEVKQRPRQGAQPRLLGAPVRHLHIDVEHVAAVPGRPKGLGPHALQVRRQRALARRRHEEVSAVVEHEGLEKRVRGLVRIPRHQRRRLEPRRVRCVGEVEAELAH